MAKTIKEIEAILKDLNDTEIENSFLNEIKKDERKGVQLLYKKWLKEQVERQKLKEQFAQMSIYENDLRSKNIHMIAGIDEAGRGPLAGPVVAAAVILKSDFFLPGLNDSKKLTEKKRESFYQYIESHALSIGIGMATAKEIDELNIYQASKLAMVRAVQKLSIKPEYLLIDAMEIPLSIPQTSIVKGDSKSISIAAASIIAKVTRDRYMKDLGKRYPQYGFESHMGYGTNQHLKAIETFGITSEHRSSFAPVKEYVKI